MRKANSVENGEKRQGQIDKRDVLMESAVRMDDVNLVWIWAPGCPQSERNHALGTAIKRRNEGVILKLLEYGADPNLHQNEFTDACRAGDHTLVSMILRAPIQMQAEALMGSLGEAVKSGSLHTLTILLQATDLGSTKDIDAVGEAVRCLRVDMLLRLLLRARSLDRQILDGLVNAAFEMSETDSNKRLQIIDALFYAGAAGHKSAASFAHAVALGQMDFIRLFAKHHVDINWARGICFCRGL